MSYCPLGLLTRQKKINYNFSLVSLPIVELIDLEHTRSNEWTFSMSNCVFFLLKFEEYSNVECYFDSLMPTITLPALLGSLVVDGHLW